jgi:hypothetical protein
MQLDKATPKPALGIVGDMLIQKAQLPLEYLTLSLLEEWINLFVETAGEYRSRFIVNWGNLKSDGTKQVDGDWLKI